MPDGMMLRYNLCNWALGWIKYALIIAYICSISCCHIFFVQFDEIHWTGLYLEIRFRNYQILVLEIIMRLDDSPVYFVKQLVVTSAGEGGEI
jgi:hypothetical protein